MGKVRSISSVKVRKLTGGKDPVKLVEDFIVRRGFDPQECCRDRGVENIRWVIPLQEGEDLEVLLEGINRPHETTIYMGVNVATVPLRGAQEVLVAALEIADGLVGIKVSLVGHFLIISASSSAAGLTLEELDYNYEIICAQKEWFRETLADELGLDELA